MKKRIIATVITVCLVLCTIIWLQSEASGEEDPGPSEYLL